MEIDSILTRCEKIISIFDVYGGRVFWLMTCVGATALFGAMCLVFVNVILRYIFDRPISGTAEINGLVLVTVVFFGLAYVALEKKHILIDVLSARLPPKINTLLNIITDFGSALLLALMVWRSIEQALLEWKLGHNVYIINVPIYIFLLLIAFGSLTICLTYLRYTFENVIKALKLGFGVRLWATLFGIVSALTIIVILLLQHKIFQLDPLMVGMIGTVVMILLLFSGMSLAVVFMIVAFVFLSYGLNLQAGFQVLGGFPFSVLSGHTWVVIALFIVMGYVALYAGFGKDLFDTAHKWFSHLRGGMAIATIGAGTGFAAIVGDAASAAATLTVTAFPEMKRYNYGNRLATGCIAAASTLGPLIPPSVTLIVYGVATLVSISSLLIAGIIPGLLLAIIFAITVRIIILRNPQMGGDKALQPSLTVRLLSLIKVIPIVVIFLIVIGGMYIGVFSPTEGGAIGGIAVLITGLLMRRFNIQNLLATFMEALKLISLLFFVIVGALMFGFFLTSQGVGTMLQAVLSGTTAPPWVVLIFIGFVYTILGMIMDPIAMLLITIPIFFPVITHLGYDPIWFGVISVMFMHLGLITPPVAFSCYTIKALAPDVPISDIFRGVVPFALATLVAIVIVAVFPQIALFLPNLLR